MFQGFLFSIWCGFLKSIFLLVKLAGLLCNSSLWLFQEEDYEWGSKSVLNVLSGINVNQKKLALAAMRWRKKIHKGRQETGIVEVHRYSCNVSCAMGMDRTGIVTKKLKTSLSGEGSLVIKNKMSWLDIF